MSRLVEILRGTARATGLTGALLATAAFTHLYTRTDMMKELQNRELQKYDSQYDFNNTLIDFNQDGLEKILDALYTVRTKSIFQKEKDNSQVELEMEGGGTVLLGSYFVTVDHVVNHPGPGIRIGPFFAPEPAKKISETSYLVVDDREVEMEPVYRSKRNDLAVFKIPEGITVDRPFPYKLGESDELRPGHFLYAVGVPGLLGKNVREGICSSRHLDKRLDGFCKTDNAFMVSNGLNPGDSGTMIVAVRDGKYELVGLPQGKFTRMEGLGWAVGITPIKKLLRRHLEKNDLAEKYADLYQLVK